MRIVSLLTLLLLLQGCGREPELQKSVFIEDPAFPGLPQYSEWGYNTFGAYYNRQVFISNNFDTPAQVIYFDNKSSLIFAGRVGPDMYNNVEIKLTINLPNFHPGSYQDLIALDQKVYDLTQPEFEILIDTGTETLKA